MKVDDRCFELRLEEIRRRSPGIGGPWRPAVTGPCRSGGSTIIAVYDPRSPMWLTAVHRKQWT